MLPMVGLTLGSLLPTFWLLIARLYVGSVLMLIGFAIGFVWLRMASNKDAWRFKQEYLRLVARRQRGNVEIWGGVSYGPHRLKKR